MGLCSVYQCISLLMHKRRILMKRKEVVIRQPQASTDGVGRWGTSDSWGWWAIHCQLLIYFSEPFHVAARKLICQEPGRLPALGKISATSWLEQTYSAGCIDPGVQNCHRKPRYKTVSEQEIIIFSFLFYASSSCSKVKKFSLGLIQRREICRFSSLALDSGERPASWVLGVSLQKSVSWFPLGSRMCGSRSAEPEWKLWRRENIRLARNWIVTA